MKRIISLLLAAVMVLSLCACGSSKPQKKSLDELTAEDFQAAAEQLMGEEAETQAPTEVEQKVYKLGETITMMDDMIELTVNSICFTDDPSTYKDTSTFRYHAQHGPSEGKTFLIFNASLEFKGNLKQTFTWFDSAYYTNLMKVDYNDGYEFERIVGEFFDSNDRSESMAQFEALSDNRTRTWLGLFEVPKVVETDTASPLLLKFVALGRTENYADYNAELPITIQLR